MQGGASCSSCTRSDREGVTWLNKEKVGVALILPFLRKPANNRQLGASLSQLEPPLTSPTFARQGRAGGKSLQDVLQQNLPQSLTRCESGGATSLNL